MSTALDTITITHYEGATYLAVRHAETPPLARADVAGLVDELVAILAADQPSYRDPRQRQAYDAGRAQGRLDHAAAILALQPASAAAVLRAAAEQAGRRFRTRRVPAWLEQLADDVEHGRR